MRPRAGVAPRVHKPNDPIPSQHTLLHSLFSIHLHQPQCLRIFSTETPGSQREQGPVRQTEVSPVRPTSEAISDAYRDLSGTPFSSTPANQQRVRGARPFSSPSPVPSASRSYKRTRLDDSSPSDASMRLHMDASADSLNPYDIPDDGAQWPAGDFSGSQVRCGDLQGYLQPAVKARVDQYVQQCVADAVERAVATIEGKVEALKARVDPTGDGLTGEGTGKPHAVKRSTNKSA